MTLLFTMIGVFVFIKMKPYQSVPVFFLAAVTFVSPKLVKLINLLQNSVFCQINSDRKLCFSVFIISALSLTLLSGLVIPSLLIKSSTQADFAYIDGYSSPLYFIYVCFLECTGLFLLWPLVIYFLYGKNVRNFLAALFYIIADQSLRRPFGRSPLIGIPGFGHERSRIRINFHDPLKI